MLCPSIRLHPGSSRHLLARDPERRENGPVRAIRTGQVRRAAACFADVLRTALTR
ncbi:hypothetical protein SUDANB15_00295 [Streptomyces sp. enrichment culture]